MVESYSSGLYGTDPSLYNDIITDDPFLPYHLFSWLRMFTIAFLYTTCYRFRCLDNKNQGPRIIMFHWVAMVKFLYKHDSIMRV